LKVCCMDLMLLAIFRFCFKQIFVPNSQNLVVTPFSLRYRSWVTSGTLHRRSRHRQRR